MAAKLRRLFPLVLALVLFLCQSPLPTPVGAEVLGQTPQVNAAGAIRPLADGDYFPTLMKMINMAGSSIDLAMFLFNTSDREGNRPAMIRDGLIRAAKRGVKIRIFLERSGYDDRLNDSNQRTAEQLDKAGIKVIFDSAKKTTHTKLVVIDRRFSLVGSHNFTQAALRHNHEMSLLIDDQVLANELVRYMTENIKP